MTQPIRLSARILQQRTEWPPHLLDHLQQVLLMNRCLLLSHLPRRVPRVLVLLLDKQQRSIVLLAVQMGGRILSINILLVDQYLTLRTTNSTTDRTRDSDAPTISVDSFDEESQSVSSDSTVMAVERPLLKTSALETPMSTSRRSLSSTSTAATVLQVSQRTDKTSGRRNAADFFQVPDRSTLSPSRSNPNLYQPTGEPLSGNSLGRREFKRSSSVLPPSPPYIQHDSRVTTSMLNVHINRLGEIGRKAAKTHFSHSNSSSRNNSGSSNCSEAPKETSACSKWKGLCEYSTDCPPSTSNFFFQLSNEV